MIAKKNGAGRAATYSEEKHTSGGEKSKTIDPLSLAHRFPDMRVFPCRADNKRPMTEHGFKDATSAADRLKAWWSQTPGAYVGMATGDGLVLIDIDEKNGKSGSAALESLEQQHGKLPDTLTIRTRSGGFHRYFVYDHAGAVIKSKAGKPADGIDIRANGGYAIVPPSDGYSVINDIDPAPLPPAWVELLREKKRTSSDPEHKPSKPDSDDKKTALDCLQYIPASIGYDDWIRAAMAAKASGLTVGDFIAWSSTGGDAFKGDADCKAHWESFKKNEGDNALKLPTLVDMAKAYGYDPAAKGHYGEKHTSEALKPVRNGITAAQAARAVPRKPWRYVDESQVLESIAGTNLQPLVEALAAPTIPPLPIALTLPKAISLAGCALSGEKVVDEEARRRLSPGASRARVKIMTAGGQVCNAWTLIVAASAAGKDVGGVVNDLSFSCNYFLGDGGSAEGLADALTENGNGLIQIREMADWLNKSHWQSKAAGFLTGAFSSGMFSVRLSGRSGEAPRRSDYCFPSITANIQPSTLERFGTSLDITSGFLGRFLFSYAEAHHGRPTCRDFSDLTEAAEQSLRLYENKCGVIHVGDGYLDELYGEFVTNGAHIEPVWKRHVNEYGPRLALMLSASPEDRHPEISITEDGWKRAAILIRWFYAHAEKCLEGVNEDQESKRTEGLIRRMAEYIAANPGCKLQDISRNRGKNSTSRERQDALAEMQARGLISVDEGRYFMANLG